MICETWLRDAIMENSMELFLDHHPEMRGIKISQHKMLYELYRFYMESP